MKNRVARMATLAALVGHDLAGIVCCRPGRYRDNQGNADDTPEEFESHVLKVEKVAPRKSKATVRIGPLKPGRYPFVGEFHESTAKGLVVAK